MSNIFRTFVV